MTTPNSSIKHYIGNTLKFFVFLGAGLFLFWLIYKDQDTTVLFSNLKNTNYFWIALSLFAGALSHVVRAIRWQKMIEPLGYKSSFWNAFFSVINTHFANLAIPRLGEITRPGIVKKYNNIPFSVSFGTIVLERIIDMLILLILTVVIILTQSKVFYSFVHNNPPVEENLLKLRDSLLIQLSLGVLLAIPILLWVFKKQIKKTFIYVKFEHLIQEFLDGLRSFKTIKNKSLFIFHSVLIWFLYYLLTYLPFFAFEATSGISVWGGLAVFVIGSYGMVAPVQGGLGAWHFMVAGTLIVLGINDQEARSFALIVHAAQTLLIVVMGISTTALLPIVNRKKNPTKSI